jgi:cytochrome c oxidase subunit 1
MKKLIPLGIFRGLIWQVLGTILGMAIVVGFRAMLGMQPWKAESAIVFGALLGALFFVYGVGALDDWLKWAAGQETSDHFDDSHLGWKRYFGVSMDHKVIGIQYLVLSFILLSIGGIFALIFRAELIDTGMQFLTPMEYNTLMSLHGMVMIVSILLGIAAFMNYLVPMLIGARDMVFPRLNAFAFWLAVPAGIILLSSMFLGGVETGWTGYPPLSVRAPMGMQMFFLGVSLAGMSTIVGSLNIIATILRLRAKGMGAFRMPIFIWGALATSIMSLTATQLIGLSFQMVMFERLFGMGFFDPVKGGNPILFQHLFWFYSHPAVYIFVLPGLGLISEMLPVFARKPLFGYRWVAISSIAIALVGFLVWAHHMFTSGMASYLRVPFMYSTLLVAIPTGVKFFSWVATLWRGKISFETPMYFLLAGIVVFLMGGLTGPPSATISTDLHLQDSYYIVGHFHDTMFGGYIFPFFAGLYYWYPKVTGRRLNEKIGKLQFWLIAPAFIMLTMLMMRVGLLGMRRRIADYDPALGFQNYQLWMTIFSFLIGLSILVFIFNVFWSYKKGEIARGNVWNSRSPEWQVPSPMPVHNYDVPFEVVGEPYDYGLPGSIYVKFQEGEQHV